MINSLTLNQPNRWWRHPLSHSHILLLHVACSPKQSGAFANNLFLCFNHPELSVLGLPNWENTVSRGLKQTNQKTKHKNYFLRVCAAAIHSYIGLFSNEMGISCVWELPNIWRRLQKLPWNMLFWSLKCPKLNVIKLTRWMHILNCLSLLNTVINTMPEQRLWNILTSRERRTVVEKAVITDIFSSLLKYLQLFVHIHL